MRHSLSLRAAMYDSDSARLAEAQHELADVLMSKGEHLEAIALMGNQSRSTKKKWWLFAARCHWLERHGLCT